MGVNQHVHHRKPGGKQTLPINKWVAVSGLGTFKTTGFGHIKTELYLNVTFEDDPQEKLAGGGVLEARLVRKAYGRLPVDPCGADSRPLMKGIKNSFFRMKTNEPIGHGEKGRTYYWQVRVRGVKSAYLTTRYDDFWRLT